MDPDYLRRLSCGGGDCGAVELVGQVKPYYRDTDHGERMDYLKAVRELRRSKR